MMKVDIRTDAASFYDLNPISPTDAPFYQRLLPSPMADVLELGCGTGRVGMELIPHCARYQGIDLSTAMLNIFRGKLARASVDPGKARVDQGDISCFDLGCTFDFIIAPFRVMQNLESDAEVDGLFQCIHKHLAPRGTCILNVFMPNRDPEGLRQHWCNDEEKSTWQLVRGRETFTCSDRRPRMNLETLALYPELIYRRYLDGALQEEVILKLVMRCYYPDTFERLIRDHGFCVLQRWGGYDSEAYGEGPELVVQFGQ